MTEKTQFDSSLGGDYNLQPALHLKHFTAARAEEIQALKQALNVPSGTKLAFQRLPKHIRRRVMSHNVKRLPRRLRQIHLNQFKKSGMPPKLKRPSRKHRRRPSNLLAEYVRRQRSHVWLETHIWHAKRFHMVKKWGYVIGERPCDKAFRACYRASTKHCLVQDISYFTCVELTGPVDIIVDRFKTICNGSIGLSINAKAYIKGNREGQVVLFNFLKKAVGRVYFNWKPAKDKLVRTLWLWVHPAYFSETFNLLTESFKADSVEILVLKEQLTRFSLTGPLSIAILKNVLKPPSESHSDSEWFNEYLTQTENAELFRRQTEYWNTIENTVVSPHSAISLAVKDPRFNLPKTKVKATLNSYKQEVVDTLQDITCGEIWNNETRKNVKDNKLSNAKIADLRSEMLVPGSEITDKGEVVPVMVIYKPGNQSDRLGYSNGWDLIVPAGWGNTFWISLVIWGGRAGGLREFNSVRFEQGLAPFLEPDIQSGAQEEQELTKKHTERFFKLPPNKRPNYTKLGIIQPFHFNWKLLVQEWSSEPTDEIVVLRNRKVLADIQDFLAGKTSALESSFYKGNTNKIVPVRVKAVGPGTVKHFARIFLAERKDMIKPPSEPLYEDKNAKQRKSLRTEHQALLKRLRRQRKNAKLAKKEVKQDLETLEGYRKQMQELWMPQKKEYLRITCLRQVMGFVTYGDFSFIQACGCGVGYIAAAALKALESQKARNKILIRNITDRQYRLATLEVIT